MNPMKVVNAAAILLSVLISQSASAGEWFLLSRHGVCAPLDALRHKLPSAPNLNTPDDLEAYLQTERMKYSRKVHSGESGQLHEFQVPVKGLSVMLVPRQQCMDILPGSR